MSYSPSSARYQDMQYARCGNSGLLLPKISLGLWHNFGEDVSFERSQRMAERAFDLGITHFDLANNYGPPPGSAERCFGRILKRSLGAYRDELILSTKAGYHMWPGPYGEWGSRKYLLASLDQSLKRLGVDYVDIFYHHRPDPDTPIEETMAALDHAVRSGKALYVGISNYSAEQTQAACKALKDLGTPCLIHQPSYSMLNRAPEAELFDVIEQQRIGSIVFSPLAQGLLTSRYLKGVPEDSRAKLDSPFLRAEQITDELLARLRALNSVAEQRGQTLAQLALCWVLRQSAVTSALVGASRPEQIEDSVRALENLKLSEAELETIERAIGKDH